MNFAQTKPMNCHFNVMTVIIHAIYVMALIQTSAWNALKTTFSTIIVVIQMEIAQKKLFSQNQMKIRVRIASKHARSALDLIPINV
jgi:hypothetical protein